MVKDRTYFWLKSAERYGRPWKEVRDNIQSKGAHFAALDNVWYTAKSEEAQAAADEEAAHKARPVPKQEWQPKKAKKPPLLNAETGSPIVLLHIFI
ncbi:hypothetical protein E8L90_03295 [Brevibacillus antibioticus]|uniref:Uncharacterized protein n=1 Tax=Brevibacillus antibioticus TaxID=2570228 RepID=A0A4U2Y3H7_9BACL|nr:hypothetical protein [Brevibacillus antibioticus]TKI54545.1 hypothetical protein E8L90_03295 [Brevibacillus antibioticus]